MLREPRMMLVYGVIVAGALQTSFRGQLMPFISHTIETTDVQVQFRYASLASAMFGVGQLIGSPLVGYVNDKLGGGRSVARVLLVIHLTAYLVTIIFNEIHSFGPLAYLVTLLCGMQDAALQTQVTIICGFEFKTNVEPFAIYRLLGSLVISAVMAGQAFIATKEAYRYFFIISFLITLGS
jgi:MFS family permease